MTPALLWTLARTVGPWLALAGALAGVALLVLDRNHLAALNDRHVACTAAVEGRRGAKPPPDVCDLPIARAKLAADQAADCDAGLRLLAEGAPATCSGPVQHVAADRDARTAEVADRDRELAGARQVQAAAVVRAEARARTNAQKEAHADAVLNSAPRDAGGAVVLDAGRLRDLSGPDPAAAGLRAGHSHPG